MKKQYIIPQTNITKINPVCVIAASITGTNVDGLGMGGGTNGTITEGGTRESNGWDDIWD